MKLHFREQGTGLPLVLIHGFPLDHTLWLPQLRSLSDMARVIAPDLRGFGSSPGPDAVMTMEAHARDVKRLLDELGIRRAVIGGLSMGGYVALAFAELFPEMLQGLLLCSTRAVADDEAGKRMREITALKALDGGMAEIAVGLAVKLISAQSMGQHPEWRVAVQEMMARQSPAGVAASSRGMAARPDRSELLSRLQVPTLVIAGADDVLFSPKESQAMAAKLPKGSLHLVPGAGHLVNLEDESTFNGAVRNFLDTIA
jgi:pimeloyl-ACP methyl ester carboxylesterase